MSHSLRTFIAIPIPCSQSVERILQQLRNCGGSLRVVLPDSLHLTLAFLGETAPAQLPDVSALIDALATSCEPFTATLSGLGVFPNSDRPSVIWAGLQPVDIVRQLAGDLAERLERLGFPRERREFQPHITLARVSATPSQALLATLDEFASASFGTCEVGKIVYYQSELTSGAPHYRSLSSHSFPS